MSDRLLDRIQKSLVSVQSLTDYALDVVRTVSEGPGDSQMFGRARPGRTWQDLAYVAGPLSDNPRKVIEQGGQRVDGGPTERWTEEEVWAALEPMVRSQARKYSRGEWTKSGKYDPNTFEDLVQNAALQIMMVLRRGDDQGRIGNSFQGWIKGWIRTAVRNGVGDVKYVRARGYLGKLMSAKSSEEVQNELNDPKSGIPEQYRQANARGLEIIGKNRYGEFSPMLFRFSTQLIAALDSGDEKLIKKVKEQVRKEHERLTDEEPQFAGATTGAHTGDVVALPHSGEHREEFRDQHKIVAPQIQGEGGEMIDRPGMPSLPDDTEALANKQMIKKFLEAARYGYKEHGWDVAPMSDRNFRIMIRHYGISDYPSRGKPDDPEFNPEAYQQKFQELDQIHALQTKHPEKKIAGLEVSPVSVYEADKLAGLAGMSAVDKQEFLQQTAEFVGLLEKGVVPTEDDKPTLQITPDDKRQADAIARLLAYSPWVRAGCPPLTAVEINKGYLGIQLNVSNVRMDQLLNDIGKPSGPSKGKKAKTGWLRAAGDDLGDWFGDKDYNESIDPRTDVVLEAMLDFWRLTDEMRSKFYINESLDSYEYEVVAETARAVQQNVSRYLTELNTAH